MQIQPIIPKNPGYRFIEEIRYRSSKTGLYALLNNKTYFILAMVIYLMNTINKKHCIQIKFKELLLKYPNIDTRAMGFPDEWKSDPFWM